MTRRCTMQIRSFMFLLIALALYNQLPLEVRKSPILNTFKSRLNTLFQTSLFTIASALEVSQRGSRCSGTMPASHIKSSFTQAGMYLARGAGASESCAVSLMHLGWLFDYYYSIMISSLWCYAIEINDTVDLLYYDHCCHHHCHYYHLRVQGTGSTMQFTLPLPPESPPTIGNINPDLTTMTVWHTYLCRFRQYTYIVDCGHVTCFQCIWCYIYLYCVFST